MLAKVADKLKGDVGTILSVIKNESHVYFSTDALKCMRVIEDIEKESLRDRVFGLMIGSFIGDSCGASLDVESYLPL